MTSAVQAHFQPHSSPSWFAVTIGGVAAILAGIWLLVDAVTAATFLLTALAVYWLITGAVATFRGATERESWTWGLRLAGGLGRVLAGLLILAQPQIAAVFTVVVLYYLLVVAAVVTGLFEIVDGLMRKQRDWLEVGLGGLQVLIGVLLFIFSLAGGLQLFVPLIGLTAIASGVLLFVSGLQLHRRPTSATST